MLIALSILVLSVVLLYLGAKLMAALDDLNNNLTRANGNLTVLADTEAKGLALLQGLGGGQTGGATEAQVAAAAAAVGTIADNIKAINNAAAADIPGATVIA